MPGSVDKNTRRCYPVTWSQSGAIPVTDWFRKYVVTSVFLAPVIRSAATSATTTPSLRTSFPTP
ncbi:hypothetical protein [Streptomyces sp. M1013]|uniref:hypothetical protein n=1 Tax=Streptomyces sp. M1013 TaxID=549798 RepID=UPI00117ECE38|nr:hypothetical protein [Streptomyces sp. M1013]